MSKINKKLLISELFRSRNKLCKKHQKALQSNARNLRSNFAKPKLSNSNLTTKKSNKCNIWNRNSWTPSSKPMPSTKISPTKTTDSRRRLSQWLMDCKEKSKCWSTTTTSWGSSWTNSQTNANTWRNSSSWIRAVPVRLKDLKKSSESRGITTATSKNWFKTFSARRCNSKPRSRTRTKRKNDCWVRWLRSRRSPHAPAKPKIRCAPTTCYNVLGCSCSNTSKVLVDIEKWWKKTTNSSNAWNLKCSPNKKASCRCTTRPRSTAETRSSRSRISVATTRNYRMSSSCY